MTKTLSFKLGMIALLMLLLLIPLLMIGGLIGERQALRDSVLQDIAQSSSFSQQISGPLLVVPYRKYERRWIEKNGQSVEQTIMLNGQLFFLPETFHVDTDIDTELRARGIYQARLFHAKSRVSGRFKVPARWGIEKDWEDYRFDRPYLVVGISDIRGIENALLGALLGTHLSLSAMDYNALASANVDALDFSSALATQLHLTAGTYDSVLQSSATVG